MKTWLKSHRGFLLFLLCFAFFRTAVADWNVVPSGSMRPTILEGDVVFINRLAYDLKVPLTELSIARLGEPQRGDIVTFSSPKDGTRLIKRVVALPGDVVAMHDGVLFINGSAARYSETTPFVERVGPGVDLPATRAVEHVAGATHAVQYLSFAGAARAFGPVVVPQDSYFMLGDSRDNSEDSRFIGAVPRGQLIGRAERTLVSADIVGDWMPRLQRTWARLE